MFAEAFEKLDPASVVSILERVNPLMQGIQFDPSETVIMGIDIPFYPGYQLLDLADYSNMPASRRYVIYSDKHSIVLDFTNEPIYSLNHANKLKINEDNIAEYVRFFFSFVRGKQGRFVIVENVDDIRWKDDPPPSARKAIGKMAAPIVFKKQDEKGVYQLQATMTYKNSLFRSNIAVKPDGVIEISNEELLVEDMPVLDDTFGQ